MIAKVHYLELVMEHYWELYLVQLKALELVVVMEYNWVSWMDNEMDYLLEHHLEHHLVLNLVVTMVLQMVHYLVQYLV